MAQYPPHLATLCRTPGCGQAVTCDVTDEIDGGHPVYEGTCPSCHAAARTYLQDPGLRVGTFGVPHKPDTNTVEPISDEEVSDAVEANPHLKPVHDEDFVPAVPSQNAGDQVDAMTPPRSPESPGFPTGQDVANQQAQIDANEQARAEGSA